MGARHYDPATGRFLQPDPLGIAASELYAYAANNPYVFWDPTGLSPISFSGAAWDAAGTIGVGLGTAAASIFVPGAGEALDAYTLADTEAASWERGLAAVSLGVGVYTAGLSPNASGVIHGGRQVASGFGDLAAAAGDTLRRFVRQSEFDQIQKAIDTGGYAQLGRFFTPDDIVNPRVAASQLALPGTGRNPIVGFVDVPRGALPSEPLTAFGPRLTQPFRGTDLVGLPGGGLEVEFAINPVVPGELLRLTPTR
jgi:hypothetical protein